MDEEHSEKITSKLSSIPYQNNIKLAVSSPNSVSHSNNIVNKISTPAPLLLENQ